MEILYNESLKKYTTIRIGGQAKIFYIPENKNELIKLINKLSNNKYYIIGGGSNLLINDKKTFDNVILLREFDKSIVNKGNGNYYVGASVKLQKLIDTVNRDGFGGIEYLYSVPALVGGSIVMNAGRGKSFGFAISDYLVDVHVYKNGEITVMKKEDCCFEYRNSIFKNSETVVLGATFKFEDKDVEKSTKLKNDRLKLCRNVQDNSGFNFGSVFKKVDPKLFKLVRMISRGNKDGVVYSKKTSNWILNQGNGTYMQAINIITSVEKVHKIFGKKAVREVITFD